MTVEQNSVLARDQVVIIEPQSDLDTMAMPTSAGAVKFLKFGITYEQVHTDRVDNRVTAGLVEQIPGKRTVGWEGEEYLRPSGVAGTAPDDHELWQSLFGTETIAGGVSVTYTPSTTQAIKLNSMHRAHGSGSSCEFLESLIGAWVSKLKISVSGNDPVKLTWSGGARRYVTTGPSTLNGDISSTAATVATVDANSFQVDSIVQVGATTGNRVTAKTGAALTLTSAATALSGAAILPWVPAETTAGIAVAGIDGSFTLVGPAGSATILVLSADLEFDKALKPYDDEYGTADVTDVGVGWRKVSGTLTFRLRRREIQRILAAKNDGYTARALTIVAGGVAGATCTASIARAKLNFKGVTFPDNGDEATVQVPFTSFVSSDTANDEISVAFT